ncbi:L-aminopeptidase/D-esterase [Hartmannibacter diazotrophicus]|uniref:L-aminopeptidase/D-esterase n=1 Tax=Hartmannibacter diazotrophicus TaxID=1482074 RepID=A0A2C9D961_9HYPH|nr:P1 family peptidase [Hartmannibacter diazotrophicus]SON56115.1 L-aminopeptidase/D-esterase [Hartmannibacter diazotrophicus]
MKAGPRNLITDVPGLSVGNATDIAAGTGVTVLLPETPAVASVHIMGGAPGTRETDLLAPEHTVETVDALVLSGGSAFGLEAASGVMAGLVDLGRGFAVGDFRVPIVPAAILFDLRIGEKPWARPRSGETPPYRTLGREALDAASPDFALGSVGAGTGATTARGKGGLGSASTVLDSGFTVGALAAVNALGSPFVGSSSHYWAAPFEIDGEFGGLGLPDPLPSDADRIVTKLNATARDNTTIAIVATDAALTKAQAKRLAVAAHDGFARALWPAHTPLDGDLVFALSTGARPLTDPVVDMTRLCAVAAATMARAIARGVHEASKA